MFWLNFAKGAACALLACSAGLFFFAGYRARDGFDRWGYATLAGLFVVAFGAAMHFAWEV